MGKIEILNVGYTHINKNSNENVEKLPNIISDPKKYRDCFDKLSANIKENLNKYQISDFHIVLVKNTDSIKISCLFGLFNKVSRYSGVIAIGVDYEGFNLVYNFFLDNYVKLIYDNSYDQIIYSQGTRIDFMPTNPLGKMFSKYDDNLRYGCAMKLSDKLINTTVTAEAIKTFASVLAKVPIKDEEFANSYYVEFAKNPGGEIAGIMLKVYNTHIILHPILTDSSEDGEFTRDLLDVIEGHLLGIQIDKDIPPAWVNQTLPDYEEKKNKAFASLNSILEEELILRNLYWSTGDDLEKAVEYAFKKLGFAVENIAKDRNSRDLLIKYKGIEWYVEVKGKEGIIDISDISKFIASNPRSKLIFVGNAYRLYPPENRPEAYTKKAIETIKENLNENTIESFYPLTSLDLINFVTKGYAADAVIDAMGKIRNKYLA